MSDEQMADAAEAAARMEDDALEKLVEKAEREYRESKAHVLRAAAAGCKDANARERPRARACNSSTTRKRQDGTGADERWSMSLRCVVETVLQRRASSEAKHTKREQCRPPTPSNIPSDHANKDARKEKAELYPFLGRKLPDRKRKLDGYFEPAKQRQVAEPRPSEGKRRCGGSKQTMNQVASTVAIDGMGDASWRDDDGVGTRPQRDTREARVARRDRRTDQGAR